MVHWFFVSASRLGICMRRFTRSYRTQQHHTQKHNTDYAHTPPLSRHCIFVLDKMEAACSERPVRLGLYQSSSS